MYLFSRNQRFLGFRSQGCSCFVRGKWRGTQVWFKVRWCHPCLTSTVTICFCYCPRSSVSDTCNSIRVLQNISAASVHCTCWNVVQKRTLCSANLLSVLCLRPSKCIPKQFITGRFWSSEKWHCANWILFWRLLSNLLPLSPELDASSELHVNRPQYQFLFKCCPLPRKRQRIMLTLISG